MGNCVPGQLSLPVLRHAFGNGITHPYSPLPILTHPYSSFLQARCPSKLVFVLREGEQWINNNGGDFTASLAPQAAPAASPASPASRHQPPPSFEAQPRSEFDSGFFGGKVRLGSRAGQLRTKAHLKQLLVGWSIPIEIRWAQRDSPLVGAHMKSK